jgi:hypothetical protein
LPRIESLTKVLDSWRQRRLSFRRVERPGIVWTLVCCMTSLLFCSHGVDPSAPPSPLGVGGYGLLSVARLDAVESEGLWVRSRVRWAEEGESSTSFFFKSLRKNRARNSMHIIKHHAGIYVNTTAELLEAWQGFY